tara:strand:- start:784 stop:1014 length:231 start_codon:yes stop_codon:yes gene_type:complete
MITDGTLYLRLTKIHPSLTEKDFNTHESGTIKLQNIADGNGDFIASWNHPSLTRPTDDAIKAVTISESELQSIRGT